VQKLLMLNLDEVRQRPHFSDHAFDLFRWIESTTDDGMVILLAHNGNRFDHKILRHHFEERGLHIPPNWYFEDTLPLCKKLLPGLKSYAIVNLASGLLEKTPTGLHQASTDVTVLWTILKIMIKEEDDEKALTMIARQVLHDMFGMPLAPPSYDLDEADFLVE